MFTQEEIASLIEKAVEGGFAKFRDRKYYEAEMIVKQALKVSPDEPRALQLLGLVKHNLGEYQEAIRYFERGVELNSNNAENFNNLGLCYANLGDFSKSIECLLRGTELSPNSAYIKSNLALQYRQTGDTEKAVECLRQSLAIKEDAHTWGMLGGCFGELKNLEEAEKCFKKALELEPELPNIHVDLACLHHLRGEWAAGWKEYEWRYELYDQVKYWHKIYDPALKWDGSPIAGKRLMVYAEQGNGDAIHFFRYVKVLREMGVQVILHCGEVLKTLFSPHVDEIYTTDPTIIPTHDKRWPNYEMPKFDYHCSLISLPHLLGNPPVPPCPYLFTKKEINMADYSDYFRVGVCWAGNPQHPNDASRSCPLRLFRDIHDIPNVKLFSLVKDARPRAYRFQSAPVDLTAGTEEMRVVDMAPLLGDFEDTAAVIQSLDLVITVDTAVLHLAGAINKPAWALIPWNPDWRWTLTGETTGWYSSIKLYRQQTKNEWKSVFTKILEDLKEISSGFQR